MDLGLDGKVAIVTGGASGIGAATARALAEEGAAVVVADLNEPGASDVASEIAAGGGTATALAVDVSRSEDIDRVVATAVAEYGRLDLGFNNAAITQGSAPIHETSEAFYDHLMAVNLKGVWLGMRAQLREMVTSGSGAIVNTASIAGVTGAPGLAVYTAAKHGVIGLTRAAALEYADQPIRVNAIAPGTTDTPMVDDFIRESGDPRVMDSIRAAHPLGRAGSAAEMAAAAVWLASEQSSFVTGHTLLVDGGFTAQ